jgi:hypothetical protein
MNFESLKPFYAYENENDDGDASSSADEDDAQCKRYLFLKLPYSRVD